MKSTLARKSSPPRPAGPENIRRDLSAAEREMLAQAGKAAEFLRSLASEHRLAILCVLQDGPRPVGAIADILGLTQPNISQHLARLKGQGLVEARRVGTTIYYSAGGGPGGAIVKVLKKAFCS
jgi:ArsR family transcriptional regulator, virulence genes transcriptional regulator